MAAPHTTVDPAEIARFSALADEWWDPHGKFRPLHRLNPLRLAYIRDALCTHFHRDAHAERPLTGLSVLDIGCGGGLLAEPLARLGALVTGIDAAEENVKTAAVHAADGEVPVAYRCATAEELAAEPQRFDAVLALEVVEHVADVGLFLDACCRLMKPDGMLVLSTLNRTPKAFLLAIVGAEYLLRWLPRGTHDWRKFLRPSEIAAHLRRNGVVVRDLTGVVFDPVRDQFRLSPRDLDVNYMLWAAR